MTCGIYLITNKINGHMYVGQSVNIENRFSQHRRCLDIDSLAIDRAINKYGWENFKTDIICELERDEELLDEMENIIFGNIILTKIEVIIILHLGAILTL